MLDPRGWRPRYAVVSAFLNMGMSVAKKTDMASVQGLISELHPKPSLAPLVRLGVPGDGGYLLPDDLDGVVGCFSPGVDDRASFEADLIGRGIPCFLADATSSKGPIDSELCHFLPKFLGVVNDETTITLDDWVKTYAPPSGDLVLQMDIEGAEWPVLLNASDAVLSRFRTIVIETHDMERLMDKHAFRIMSAVFSRLLRLFNVVHIHPNNSGGTVRVGGLTIPRALELTLYRKDRPLETGYVRSFPHPLDVRNVTGRPDVMLPKTWYRAEA